MSQDVSVFITTRQMDPARVELVLEAMDGAGGRWSKVYDGSLFLSMDAQSLGLLEAVPVEPGSRTRFRLKRSGTVCRDLLQRMRFVEEPGTAA